MTTETLERTAPTLERPRRAEAFRMEGGLLSPDILERIRAGEIGGQKAQDLGVPPGRSLVEWVAGLYRDALDLWRVFRRRLERLEEHETGSREARRWMEDLLELLGYDLHRNDQAYEVEGLRYPISHRAGKDPEAPPVHIVGARQDLGRVDPQSTRRVSPHGLLQEFLNRSEHTWGLVSNGRVLRLLRKSTAVRLQIYLEFDLEALFEGDAFAEFLLLYRLLHRSRLPGRAGEPCLLDEYQRVSEEEGNRARERLRDGVEEALRILGTGLLRHPENTELRKGLEEGRLTPWHFYEQLLRLVYRFLFLLVVEERGILGGTDLYREHYSISRLRRLVDRRSAYTDHEDLWLSLRALWHLLRDATPQVDGKPLAHLLGIPVLDGGLFTLLDLEQWHLTNRDLLRAFWHLSYYYDPSAKTYRRVNYSYLDVEELGSVYEALLDNRPAVRPEAGGLVFAFEEGLERKATGSYYTPRELVAELVRSALEPVLQERLKGARTQDEKERAILSIRVLDPATGSGHFLLAAARRLGLELARVRTGEEEPDPEAVRSATREVISHCIYGVDKNPLAVDLCKVALWIEAQLPGRPLTFLDHRIRCGDSLVGVFDLQVLSRGIPDEAYDRNGVPKSLVRGLKRKNRLERAGQKELVLVEADPLKERVLEAAVVREEITRSPDETPEHLARKERYLLEAEQKVERERLACDLWVSAFFWDLAADPQAPTTDTVRRALGNPSQVRGDLIGKAQAIAGRYPFFHWPLEFPEVLLGEGGFDVVLSNPPFLGGLKISGTLGPQYRHWLEVTYPPYGGTADLCAVFYRRAFALLKPGGRLGMVATNTIGQGDTRQSGLAVILRKGGRITFARRFIKWPGVANVEVNLIAIHKPDRAPSASPPSPTLDGQPVPFISSRLDAEPEAEPQRLPQNEGKAFQGSIVRGIGFVLDPEEAQALIARNPRNRDCLFPYLNGEDLNSHPEQKPSRWVICFFDWPLEKAAQYPDLLRIVEERVKPEREKVKQARDRENWWLFSAYRVEMHRAIAPLRRVLVRSEVGEMHMLNFVPKGYIYSHMIIVFAFDDYYHFALLQSNVHETWVRRNASTMRTDIRYTPTDCFDTFPFPPDPPEEARAWAERVGEEYHEFRRQVMRSRWLGLTKTYHLFHDPECQDPDIRRLRDLHAEMDRAVLACYGWHDLELHHDFYPNDRGQIRFTLSPEARREVLRRLLELNLRLARGIPG